MSAARTTRISVTVSGKPVSDRLEFTRRDRTYRVTYASRDYYYGEGNWTPQRWGGAATIVKKDGSLGEATTTYIPWGWEPDAETARQFANSARQQLRRACDLQTRIA